MSDISHAAVLAAAMEHLQGIFDESPDGVYVWVDQQHKDCNDRCAALFGRTAEDWRAQPDFLEAFVAPEDRAMYGGNYQKHVAGLTRPATFRFQGLRKDGSTFSGETDMVPLTIHGHPVAYHFVREVVD